VEESINRAHLASFIICEDQHELGGQL